MDEKDFIKDCLDQYKTSLIENDVSEKLIMLKNSLLDTKAKNKKVIIAGNGGSARQFQVMFLLILQNKVGLEQ